MTPHFNFRILLLSTAILSTTLVQFAHADERRFTYSYETTTAPKGSWEIEQWITWKGYDDGNTFEFRHELEYGISDRLQMGLYLSDWRLTSPNHGKSKADWTSAGAEMIYSLSDPTTDVIGSALYVEFKIGPEVFALEGKLLLQKNLGPLSLVYNFVLEAEWEGKNYDEEIGVIENTLGVSYQMSPRFFIGAEATHEVEFAGWQDAGKSVVSAGPNFSFRKGSFFTTVTGLFQLSDVSGEPDAQIRVIAGFHF